MVTLRPAVEADFPHLVSILNRQLSAPTTLEAFTQANQNRPAHLPFCRLVAENEAGAVVGFATAGWAPDQDPGQYFATVRVDEPYRRQGAGLALLEALEQWARSQGAVRLEATMSEANASTLAWSLRHGFVEESRVFRSTLDLTDWDPAPFEQLAEAAGIRMTTLAELGATEANLNRYHRTCQVWERQVPGRGPRTPDWPTWREQIAKSAGWDPALVLLAVDGNHWVGLTQMERESDGSWYTHLTAMDPAYRGRGIGQALKVTAVLLANRQGVPSLSTYNHTNNGPMIAINEKLGYKPETPLVQLYKAL